ncbi:MAG: hypothetical protein VX100_15580 [Pseudomonadota bacterium]|nr:hypothetical protein [Pseudomonadota bacterium]
MKLPSINSYDNLSNAVQNKNTSIEQAVNTAKVNANDQIAPDSVFISQVYLVDFDFNSWLAEPDQANLSDEQKQQLTSLYERLSEEDFINLAKTDVLKNEQFLSLSGQLDDEHLNGLVSAIAGLSVPASMLFVHVNEYQPPRTEEEKIAQFIDVIANQNEVNRDKIISQAALYSESVNTYKKNSRDDGTYSEINLYFSTDSSANNLQNFVSSVISSDNPGDLVDKLSNFSEQQQSAMLNVLGFDNHLGTRLLDQLHDKDETARQNIVSFLGDITQKSGAFLEFSAFSSRDPDNPLYLRKGHGDNMYTTVQDMVSKTVNLLEDYEFSDEQLSKFGEDLTNHPRQQQIAYLDTFTLGLENLTQRDENNPETYNPLDDAQSATQLFALLNDETILEKMYQTRQGEDYRAGTFFKVKSYQEYQADAKQLMAHYLPSIS